MYLISLYFDDVTNKKMQGLINRVAEVTGNTFMIDNNIPPHITLLAFDTKDEQKAIKVFEENAIGFTQGEVLFASIGAFKRQVIYVETVLNEYLHNFSLEAYKIFNEIPDMRFSTYYKPFGWIPHLSLGKHLTESQLVKSFEMCIKEFGSCTAGVTKIGLAKTNPHRDISVVELKKI